MEPQKKPIHLNENDTPYLYEPFRNRMPAKRPVSYTHLRAHETD